METQTISKDDVASVPAPGTADGMGIPAPAPAKDETRGPTVYVVLERDTSEGDRERWIIAHAGIPAYSAKQAKRIVYDGSDDPEMTLVAVPLRSWEPTTLKVEKVEKVVED